MMLIDADFATIAALDLDPIKVKLMHAESGEGWTLDQANAVEFEYRRFLYLMKKFPEEQAAPRADVDIFWHYHILDTIKYAQDCQVVFGFFLHHFPYIGLRGTDDLDAHHEAGERMRELYEDTFGEPFMQNALESGTAYSIKAGQTAYSIRATETAYSIRATQAAYSIRATETAYSIRATQGALPPASRGLEFSAVADTAHQSPSSLPGTAWGPHAQGFFTVRPSLPSKAMAC